MSRGAETPPNQAVRGYPGLNSMSYTPAPYHDLAPIQ
jgi:hypothetical protein